MNQARIDIVYKNWALKTIQFGKNERKQHSQKFIEYGDQIIVNYLKKNSLSITLLFDFSKWPS